MRLSVPWCSALLLTQLWVGQVSSQEQEQPAEKPSPEPSAERRAPGQSNGVPLELALEAPDGCPDASSLRESAIRLASVGEETSSGLMARVTVVESTEGHFLLSMQTEQDGIHGVRTLDGRSCRAVMEAAALILALMLNPEAQLPSEPTAPPPKRPTGSRAPVRRTRQLEALPPSKEPLALAATAHVGLEVGALPHAGPDSSLGGTAELGRGSVWLFGSVAPPQVKLVEGDSSRGGRLWMGSGTGLGCWTLLGTTSSLAACVGTAFNWIQGKGLGVAHRRSGAVYWVSPAAGALTDVQLGSWIAFRAAALGMVPLARPKTYLDEIGPVHRPSPVEGRLLAGVLLGRP